MKRLGVYCPESEANMEISKGATVQSVSLPLAPVVTAEPWLLRMMAGWLQAKHMSHLGISNTMRLANAYNRFKFSTRHQWRQSMYQRHLDELLQENGGCTHPPMEIKDGFVIDTSFYLPHLDRVLADSNDIIAERSGQRLTANPYRSFFQDVWTQQDYEKYPAFLDFATSSDVLAVVANDLKCIPALSTILPPGIRFVESNAAFDHEPNRPKDSQLYHLDYHSRPNVYVIVLLRDTTPEHGPFTFLPRSVSQQAVKALRYGSRAASYRVRDDEIYSVVDRQEAIEFCYPRGTVLFIQSSGCFHYGSRNSVKPRFQLMIGYTGVCRTDFGEIILTPKIYPIRSTDSALRRMVLDNHMQPGTINSVRNLTKSR
jgi:hypothetical protein